MGDWARIACECSRVSGGGMGQQFGLRPTNKEGKKPHQSTENWIKDLLNIALPVRIRPNFSNSPSLPSENHIQRKLNKLIAWITALSNSMKLWAMPCRAIQDRWVMLESSDKMWPNGKGDNKPLQYSCLENPMKSMKRQKDMTLKYELPRLVDAQYAIGEEWRNKSKKNEETEPKWKQCPVVNVTGDGSKVWCYKEQYCKGTWNVRSMN